MRVIVVGLGVQGYKRREVAGDDVVAVIDPINTDADFRSVEDVPLETYDAALVCTPDDAKNSLLTYLLTAGKHVLVEKPLLAGDGVSLTALRTLANENSALCYTAYNHRFEPHFVNMRDTLVSGALGEIYSVRMFYGNGTASLVRASPWRDSGAGVLPDLGSHLLDTLLFWFGDIPDASKFELWSANRFENRAFDHLSFGAQPEGTLPLMQLEMTLMSWRNHFYADVFAEKGSAHIRSLCKWGPSSFFVRDRKLPSGRPDEESHTLIQSDPTWAHEYDYFRRCAVGPAPAEATNIDNDIRINEVLSAMTAVSGVDS
jgi:scyllo-inositol 2-dehydrogenase (NADP+)